MLQRALLINDTEDVYHWGCYGTSHAVKEKIKKNGMKLVDTIPVYDVHNLRWFPNYANEFSDKANFVEKLPEIAIKIDNCDVVIINGEGTIHHFSGYPKALLFLIYSAKTFFNKKVILINHSCFPSTEDSETINFYKKAYACCDYIAAREKRSVATITNELRMPCTLAFDSLPLTAKSVENKLYKPISEKYVCISGAVNYKHERSGMIAKIIQNHFPNHRYIYLAGSKEEGIHHEEPIVYESLKKHMHNIEMYEAKTFEEWLSVIKNAKILISGRYHYTIGAMCTGTPTVYFPSNTPKIDAIAEEYGLPKPVVSKNDKKFKLKFYMAIAWAKLRRWHNLCDKLCKSAEKNYNW
ncbi:polysaccharide pyruvyl transferase family protein [Pantoea sp. R102]|uniref:polysaccharide pyruvyl transferase family protein n=1 Tax=Pantoea sp. R102 TaxID=2507583 RepID=UPI0010A8F6DA|nr:polysaccharide pyruvyl transferase family protein [Pantoea sp. R102]THD29912.1 polysaccharide pyruvyl transferase family protein [Pantoea sp. R102]